MCVIAPWFKWVWKNMVKRGIHGLNSSPGQEQGNGKKNFIRNSNKNRNSHP